MQPTIVIVTIAQGGNLCRKSNNALRRLFLGSEGSCLSGSDKEFGIDISSISRHHGEQEMNPIGSGYA
jgi:hypothetical protein